MPKQLNNWGIQLDGWLATDAYSTAWVATVPDSQDINRPAWPETLEYLRKHQLEDGGWGEPKICYAHERTLSTLATIRTLHRWQFPEDQSRIERGIDALHRYAECLADEPYESIGFELLLPGLVAELESLASYLPLDQWLSVEEKHRQKLALIHQLRPEPGQQQSWWFSLEMLREEQLYQLNDSILGVDGSIATATAPTAAYLAAQRRAGRDSPRASVWLENLVKRGNGGVPFCWPAEVFERIWALDSFMRAGISPQSPFVQQTARTIWQAWQQGEPGLSSSKFFDVNDGDDTLVGSTVLHWAGFQPDPAPVLRFWADDHFKSYLDERNASVTVNIHGLHALRAQPDFPQRDKAQRVTRWLREQIVNGNAFADKWHISPYYALAHSIPTFIGWDNELASQCVHMILSEQKHDGGWGWLRRSTLEETAHVVLALASAYEEGFSVDRAVLKKAAEFLWEYGETPRERLWIGKTLYRPVGFVEALLYSASYKLASLDLGEVYKQAI